MSQSKKLFAKYEYDNYRNDGDTSFEQEVPDLNTAIRKGTEMGASYFQTYEIGTVEVGGKTYTGEPENFSSRHYLGQDKLYTPADVIAETGAMQKKAEPGLAQLFEMARKHGGSALAKDLDKAEEQLKSKPPIVEQAENDDADARYVKLPYAGFVRLEAGETAWDKNGTQLWPARKPAQPAPAAMKP